MENFIEMCCTDSKPFYDIHILILEIWMNHLCLKICDHLDGDKDINLYLTQREISLYNNFSTWQFLMSIFCLLCF